MGFAILEPSSWSPAIRDAYEASKKRIPGIEADPARAKREAEAAAAEIRAARTALDRWKAAIGKLPAAEQTKAMPAFSKASRQWYELASAFYAGATNLKTGQPQEEIGILPLIVVGAVVLTAAGIAFSPAASSGAEALRLHADAERARAEAVTAELAARVDASREGRSLQPSTLPPEATKAPLIGGGGSSTGLIVGGAVLALVVVGGVVVWSTSRA